ncbi:hypothetical protein HBH96_204360 [Parastagonospora nodorum]|nr:hypothetical protein HBH46_173440 [Parastagonospora nodorum]KAH4845014.1 hypothetical protein HBH75_185780 [Parastagonospora nodorum]KAH5048922.1 hypothetical protein HBH96_204360 [Parastagonospora nodorum]KAH5067290.1 hypothetical protein HBH95_198400 [Parastagonospora nodorum]KAH6104831.1 hypothetical protein HBI69_190760 [Parastagonospora nodorum]
MVDAQQSSSHARRHKTSMACNYCRVKKIKCDGAHPCANCKDHGMSCAFAATRRRHTATTNASTRAYEILRLRDRLSRVESRLPVAGQPPAAFVHTFSANMDPLPPATSVPGTNEGRQASHHIVLQSREASPSVPVIERNASGLDNVGKRLHVEAEEALLLPNASDSWPTILSPLCNNNYDICAGPNVPNEMNPILTPSATLNTEPHEDDGSCICPPEEEPTFEYHGPGSFLDICSRAGVEWVTEKCGDSSFRAMTQKLTTDISHRLKLPSSAFAREREPDPDETMAWKYTQAYFNGDPYASYGLIGRDRFEARLRAHYSPQDNPSCSESDSDWYALRNVVFACGSRSLLTASSTSLSQEQFLQSSSWSYFLNALSVHNEMMFCHSSLSTIEALAAMTFYVEGVACPSLDFMLCLDAMKLALSKGFHRKPPRAWNLAPHVIRSRSTLWWAIYSFERVNAFRSGRPLAICDEEITCQLPSEVWVDATPAVQLLTSATRLSRLLGEVTRRYTQLRLRKPTLQEVSEILADFCSQRDTLWNELPAYVSQNRRLPTGAEKQQVLYQHYTHFGVLMRIHSILIHPWNAISINLQPEERDRYAALKAESTSICIEAVRTFIRDLPQLDIDVSSPKWLVFLYPLMALVHLFTHIVQYPYSPTVSSDIALMHVIGGHFNFLEYAISDMTWPFVREIANLTRKYVHKANKEVTSIVRSDNGHQPIADTRRFDNYESQAPFDDILNQLDLESEEWGTIFGWSDLELPPSL